MKLRNILIVGLLAAGFTSCNDYLEVESPSKFDYDYVYSSKYEMQQALNGLYATLLSSNTYGSQLVNNLVHNSDIDFREGSSDVESAGSYNRLDCNADGGGSSSLWRGCYDGIEHCNIFIDQAINSSFAEEGDEDVWQMIGEAKVIRSMLYHEMVWYFGDVPYTLSASYDNNEVFPVEERHKILDDMINDLKEAAPKMKYSKDLENTVEHIGKEMAWAQIARLALTNGGYYLKPDKDNPRSYGKMDRISNYQDYYKIAADYCDSVISSGTHNLVKSFQEVFVAECNYEVVAGDDVIFEIPFAKNSTGNIGYIHGNKFESNEGATNFNYGEISGGAKIHSLARYLFDEKDLRRDYLFGLWKYTYQGVPTFEPDSYSVYNNKWSKLWSNTTLGATSKGNTGINYPYMRYTDVLLMYAEAINELENGVGGDNGAKAVEAFRQVRSRAFSADDQATKVDAYIAAKSTDKDSFLRAILDERRYEFAGENMRWKDLVRNNLYGEVIYWTFLRSYTVAENVGGGSTYAEEVAIYDQKDNTNFWNEIPMNIYYKESDNLNSPSFPNSTLKMLDFYNLYTAERRPASSLGYDKEGVMYAKWNQDGSMPGQILYSFFGYIRCDVNENPYVVQDGNLIALPDNTNNLPPVRYIIPYPRQEIQRASGAYQNYYGYN